MYSAGSFRHRSYFKHSKAVSMAFMKLLLINMLFPVLFSMVYDKFLLFYVKTKAKVLRSHYFLEFLKTSLQNGTDVLVLNLIFDLKIFLFASFLGCSSADF